MPRFLTALLSVIFICFSQDITSGQMPPNTITFDNQSGEFAIVKLIGPTQVAVEVPNGQNQTVHVESGDYYLLGRYGTQPEEYKYTKGDPFQVTQSGNKYSVITITLHKVVGGNYNARPVSGEEFENAIVSGKEHFSSMSPGISNNLINATEPNKSKLKNCGKEPVLFLYVRTGVFSGQTDSLKQEIINTIEEAGFQIEEFIQEGKLKELERTTLSCMPSEGLKSFTVVVKDSLFKSLLSDSPFSGGIAYKQGNTKVEKKFSGNGTPDSKVLDVLDDIIKIAKDN